MKLKVNLHFHTSEDPLDFFIDYDVYSGIDKAQKEGFQALALTCHRKFVYKKEMGEYAKEKGVLLIPGIELEIEKAHVILLNCDKEAEDIKSFQDLKKYRQKNKEVLVLAPHPYFGFFSLNSRLEKYIKLFDIIELAWFFTPGFNRNKKAVRTAQKFKKPLVATSDTHNIKYLNKSFAWVEVEDFSLKSLLKGIKNNKIVNHLKPLSKKEVLSYISWYSKTQLKVVIKAFQESYQKEWGYLWKKGLWREVVKQPWLKIFLIFVGIYYLFIK